MVSLIDWAALESAGCPDSLTARAARRVGAAAD